MILKPSLTNESDSMLPPTFNTRLTPCVSLARYFFSVSSQCAKDDINGYAHTHTQPAPRARSNTTMTRANNRVDAGSNPQLSVGLVSRNIPGVSLPRRRISVDCWVHPWPRRRPRAAPWLPRLHPPEGCFPPAGDRRILFSNSDRKVGWKGGLVCCPGPEDDTEIM